jgi:hypothetical protein
LLAQAPCLTPAIVGLNTAPITRDPASLRLDDAASSVKSHLSSA